MLSKTIPIDLLGKFFGGLGARALLVAGHDALWCFDRLVRTYLKKKTLRLERLFAFWRYTWAARARLWLPRALPGSILEGEKHRFSSFIAVRGPVLARSSDPYETLRGRTNFELRAFAQ